MTKRLSGRLKNFVPALLLAVLAACGKEDNTRILGHWRAERLQVQSISLPVGPEFVVTPRELTVAEGDIRIPISSIKSNDNAVTLEVPLGIGLSFYFETTDRIYFEMPLAGRVYYQRVKEIPQPARATPASQTTTVSVAPPVQAPVAVPPTVPATAPQPALAPATPLDSRSVDLIRQAGLKLASNAIFEAEALLAQARREYGDDPMIDYHLAVLRVRQGDLDAAVRSLRDAFEHGFSDFALLEASAELRQLKGDPRYDALLTRYR